MTCFCRAGSLRRQGKALQCGEFGIGGVARHAVVLHVDMHVLPALAPEVTTAAYSMQVEVP